MQFLARKHTTPQKRKAYHNMLINLIWLTLITNVFSMQEKNTSDAKRVVTEVSEDLTTPDSQKADCRFCRFS
jgi:hypothetical protein